MVAMADVIVKDQLKEIRRRSLVKSSLPQSLGNTHTRASRRICADREGRAPTYMIDEGSRE